MLSHAHSELRGADYVVFADANRRYTDCSEPVCRLLGYSREELLKLTIDDVSYTADVSKRFEQFLRQGTQDGEFVLKHKNGSPIPIRYCSYVFKDGCHAAAWSPIKDWRGAVPCCAVGTRSREIQTAHRRGPRSSAASNGRIRAQCFGFGARASGASRRPRRSASSAAEQLSARAGLQIRLPGFIPSGAAKSSISYGRYLRENRKVREAEGSEPQKSGRRARSSRLPMSPFGECPASLTEGGQPVVCWPAYETPQTEKRFHVEQRNSVESASPASQTRRL
jgi:PAS domain